MKKINSIIIKFFSLFFLVLIVIQLFPHKALADSCEVIKDFFNADVRYTNQMIKEYNDEINAGRKWGTDDVTDSFNEAQTDLINFANKRCDKDQYDIMYTTLTSLFRNALIATHSSAISVTVTYPTTTKPTVAKTPKPTTTNGSTASASPAASGGSGASPSGAASPAAATSSAVTIPSPTYSQTNGLFGNNLSDFIKNLYGWSLGIGAGLAIIMLIYAGNLYASSMGNPDGATKAKELIVGAVAGLIFLLVAGLIYQAIKSPTNNADLNATPSSTPPAWTTQTGSPITLPPDAGGGTIVPTTLPDIPTNPPAA